MNVSEFQDRQLLSQNPRTRVYRALDREGGVVALKTLDVAFPTADQINRFYNEYDILKGLALSGVRKILERSGPNTQPAFLVMEYVEGVHLKEEITKQVFSFPDKLKLAIRLAGIFAGIHRHKIIHKDVNPRNIIVDPETLDVRLIDFEFATQLDLKTHHLGNPEHMEGTLAYISPEQTGRMNRVVDYRRDLYSLGVCYYELFTGQLPFAQGDPMELVYHHLARLPKPPCQVSPDIPPVVSDIIRKLLEKNAEDRYQSAYGLKADLEKCLDYWEQQEAIPPFPLAVQDFSDRFQIPEKLYGREAELDILLKAYRSISQGNFLLLLVAGYSGVGKSSLVYGVHKPLTENRGFFIEGKFDQYQRDIPYYAWLQAFNQFVDLLLTENPVKLEAWKKQILAALNEEGKVLTEMLPRLEKIVGPQPKVQPLEGSENKARFNRLVKAFIHTISRADHPLFLFIDDWQWADAASIELLYLLTNDTQNRYFILAGAYRDNEVQAGHPFAEMVRQCEKGSAPLLKITLGNLREEDINRLLADTLHRSPAECKPLTEILNKKTRGNSFFLHQMIRTLYEKKALKFDGSSSEHKWHWDIKEIGNLGISDNVVELMVEKVERAPARTQKTLKLASCIGTLFTIPLLSVIQEDTEANIQERLQPALLEGFLIPSGTHYTFAHDRIQQAVYSLIPDKERQETHYRIGKLLWIKALSEGKQAIHEQVFDIVNQLIAGKICIKGKLEKKELAALCLRAGLKAKTANALETALIYLKFGLDLIQANGWTADYSLMFDLSYHYIDCKLNLKHFEEAEKLIDLALSYTTDKLDRMRLLERKAYLLFAQMNYDQAQVVTEEALRLCGVFFPDSKDKLHAEIEKEKQLVDRLLEQTEVASLLNSSPIVDELQLIKMQLLPMLSNIVISRGDSLKYQISVYKALHLTLVNGQSPSTAFIFSLFCDLLARNNRYQEAFQFADLAIRMIKNRPNLYRSIFTLTRACLWGLPHGRHLKETIPVFELGLRLAAEYDGFAFNVGVLKLDLLFHHLAMGYPLEETLREFEQALPFWKDSYLQFYDIGVAEKDLILHLMGSPVENSLYTEEAGRDKLYYPLNEFSRGFFSHNNLQFHFWFQDHPMPPAFFRNAREDHDKMGASIKWADYDFYASMLLIQRFPDTVAEQKAPYWPEIERSREKLRLRAAACPDNFLHKYCLVEAEIARLNDRFWEAQTFYNRAIEAAEKYGFTHVHALAHECFAQFYVERGLRHSAAGHVLEAKRLYHKWGAGSRIRQLEEKYPEHVNFMGTENAQRSTGSGSSGQALDYGSLMKASQALSGEIVLSNLLKRMLPIVMESAGAQEGAIIEHHNDGLQLIARASADTPVTIFDPIPIENLENLPFSIIHYVVRTLEVVVLSEATQSDKFYQDVYIQARHPRSVLCFPILRSEQVTAIFYFENNLVAGAFTADRLEVLRSLSGQIGISLENARLYNQVEVALARQVQLTDAYSRFVPREFIKHLGHDSILDVRLGDQVQGRMSVLFADIRSYSTLSEQMTPAENFNFINAYLKRVGPIISEHSGFVGQYYGDGFMAVFMQDPASAVQAAVGIQNTIHAYNQVRLAQQRQPIRVGIGVHTGPLMMGIIGDGKRMDTTVISDTVNTASRLEGLTKYFDAKIIISGASFAFLNEPQGLQSRFLGKVAVKGKQEVLPIYEVFNPDADDTDRKKAESKAGFEAGLARYFDKDFVNATLQLKEVAEQFPEDIVTQQYLRRAASYLVEGVPEDWTGVMTMEGK